MSKDTRAIAQTLIEAVWNGRKLDVINEVIDATYTYHDPNTPDLGNGPEGYKARVAMYTKVFPDLRLSVEDTVTDQDTVVLRWKSSGTHRGELLGIPASGKSAGVLGISVMQFKNGKVTEEWCVWDTLGLLRQIGAVPASSAA
jgi:steroid delta-isomerase-like uncharacterized protein